MKTGISIEKRLQVVQVEKSETLLETSEAPPPSRLQAGYIFLEELRSLGVSAQVFALLKQPQNG